MEKQKGRNIANESIWDQKRPKQCIQAPLGSKGRTTHCVQKQLGQKKVGTLRTKAVGTEAMKHCLRNSDHE